MIGRVEPETVQLYFKLNLEGLGTKAFYMHENLHGVLHGNKWIMLHSILGVVLGSSKKCGSNAKLRAGASNFIVITSFNFMVRSRITYYFRLFNKYVWRPSIWSLSLYIKLETPPIAKLASYFP